MKMTKKITLFMIIAMLATTSVFAKGKKDNRKVADDALNNMPVVESEVTEPAEEDAK